MKKSIYITILFGLLLLIQTPAWAQIQEPFESKTLSEGTLMKAPEAQMSYSDLFDNATQEQTRYRNPFGGGSGTGNAGNDPDAPISDGLLILLFLASIYAIVTSIKERRQSRADR